MLAADAYRDQLLALQPPGAALPTDPKSTWAKLLHGLADELSRVDARAGALLDESDPRSTAELLEDWERIAGLPDACAEDGQTVDQRRAAVHARVAGIGGQSIQYFVNLAARLGYAVTITEYRPHDVTHDVTHALYGEDWAHAWAVNVAQHAVFVHTVAGGVDDALATWGNARLECAIRAAAPAHTIVLFVYV